MAYDSTEATATPLAQSYQLAGAADGEAKPRSRSILKRVVTIGACFGAMAMLLSYAQKQQTSSKATATEFAELIKHKDFSATDFEQNTDDVSVGQSKPHTSSRQYQTFTSNRTPR